jgi:DNA-binding response OmpR family regulator
MPSGGGASTFPATTRIVAVTGLAADEYWHRANEVGIYVYLTKPFDPRFIESFVRNARVER